MKLCELHENATFAGKDPKSFKSPNGGRPVFLFVTAQGSRYLMTNDGMVLRNKSYHANTGGEDQGIQDWSQHVEFYDPAEKPGGTTFPQAVYKAIEKGLPVALGTKENKRVLLIHKDNKWKQAMISDVFKNVASSGDAVIASNYSKTPKLNWNVMDYNLRSNKTISRVHPGSPVSHGTKI